MDQQKLAEAGLNPKTIATHVRRIKRAIESDVAPAFPVIDTCRLDNGGMVRFDSVPSVETNHSIAAFIPAAGAATRYAKALVPLVKALKKKQASEVKAEAQKLAASGAAEWPLPMSVLTLLKDPGNDQVWDQAIADIHRPKALQPCVIDEDISFLQMKALEHENIPKLCGQVFVAPYEQTKIFQQHLGSNLDLPTSILEQGPELSTVRVTPAGEPLFEHGMPSIVPAGHGALAELFPQISKTWPECDAVFIRNIDNVTGIRSYTIDSIVQFLNGYSFILNQMKAIRQALHDERYQDADAGAKQIADALKIKKTHEDWLLSLMNTLFHTPIDGSEKLVSAFDRPLNVLGQVPNTSHDVGGTPCFVKLGGERIKLCLEVPHASPQDKENFLANPAKATHFNPVFACAELTTETDYYSELGDDFWLLARKSHHGKTVFYHESVLYELLGNSVTSNCIFVEIPRFLFHPRKAIADGKGSKLAMLTGASPNP